jgi:NAD(P)H-dependent FMN reductase
MMEILLLSGSVRAGSTNETMLRTAADVAAASGIGAVFYDGLATLPHFNPDLDVEPLPSPVAELRAAIARTDALLICTPEYAGTLPGSFKNLLDWTVGGSEISAKPTAWINAANPGRGEGAVATLRTVLEYTDAAIVEAACATIPFDKGTVGADGVIGDPGVREQVAGVLERLLG